MLTARQGPPGPSPGTRREREGARRLLPEPLVNGTVPRVHLPLRKELEWDRKGIHLSSTLLALWTYLLHEPLATGGLALATVFVIAVDWARLGSRRWALWIYRKFPFVFRRDERHALSGASVMMIGVTLTSALFSAKPATAGILCLAWGDSAAALVGQAWTHWMHVRKLRRAGPSRGHVVKQRGRKTLAGTLGCLVVSTVMVFLVMGPHPLLAVLGGLAAALMERWTHGRWDNLTMPLGTAGIIQLVLAWTG
jgi:dolichol kinase